MTLFRGSVVAPGCQRGICTLSAHSYLEGISGALKLGRRLGGHDGIRRRSVGAPPPAAPARDRTAGSRRELFGSGPRSAGASGFSNLKHLL